MDKIARIFNWQGIIFLCDEGGKVKAKCKGHCIEGRNICVHFLMHVLRD